MTKVAGRQERTRLERTAMWALAGILATILVGAPPLYWAFRGAKPHISYLLVAESNVLDVHKPVQDLEVLMGTYVRN